MKKGVVKRLVVHVLVLEKEGAAGKVRCISDYN
jgi:hypothetical protein